VTATVLQGDRFGNVHPPERRTPPMHSTVLFTIAATGFTVAFFHAAIPTHWLPFVLIGRARRWSSAKTLVVTACAGLGHIGLTTLLGLAIAWGGFQLDERIGATFPWVAGGFLVAMGGYYFWRQGKGKGICHHHPPGSHHHAGAECGREHDHSHWDEELKDSPLVSDQAGDWATMSGLFMMLTLSPCEGFLPIYLSGVRFGWRGFVMLSAILAVGALAGMLLFTWVTLLGMERFKVRPFEHREAGLLGILFTLLGLLVIVLEH
jgi:nickel/cobalt exporter